MKRALAGLPILGILIASLAAAPGCGDSRSNRDRAFLRALHLSPTAPAVDVFLNDVPQAVVTALAFQAGTAYLSLEQGVYNVDVSATGGTPAQAVLSSTFPLFGGQTATFVAFGNLAAIQSLVLFDDLSDTDADRIRVRAIHAASGVGQVDIYEVSNPAEPALLYENVDFGTAGAYLDLAADQAYTIGLDVDNDGAADAVFGIPALEAGTIANLFAASDGGVFLLAQLDDGEVVRINPVE